MSSVPSCSPAVQTPLRASIATAAAPRVRRRLSTSCAVLTAEFLDHQRSIGNDLITPVPEYGFPGLRPGDRWCVVAERWAQAHDAGVAPPVVLASTNVRALEVIDLAELQPYAVDVPEDLSSLEGPESGL